MSIAVSMVLHYLPVLLVGLLVLLLDIYTDPVLFKRWGREVLPAHVKKGVVYLGFGLLVYIGISGTVRSFDSFLVDLGPPLASLASGTTGGIAAVLALGAYEWRRRM